MRLLNIWLIDFAVEQGDLKMPIWNPSEMKLVSEDKNKVYKVNDVLYVC